MSTNPRQTLSRSVALDLQHRIRHGDFRVGTRLPGEIHLAKEYRVSRATIRTALQDLGSRGLITVRQGLGAMVTPAGTKLVSDIRTLTSMSETIAAHGYEPGMSYRSLQVRPATETECARLDLASGDQVLEAERVLTADGKVAAFSRDAIPMWCLGTSFDFTEVTGSIFSLLEAHGLRAETAVTELHADHGPDIGWGDRPEDASYLVLVQLHYDIDDRAVILARTAFVEGLFQFTLVRHR